MPATPSVSLGQSLQSARGLRDFLATVDRLTPVEMEQIADQAICLLESFYAHLPQKRAMYAVDPIQKLRVLRQTVRSLRDRAAADPRFDFYDGLSEIGFHSQMTETFTSLRDLHTNYLLPDYFARTVALLPFRVRHCVVTDPSTPGKSRPTYVVSQVRDASIGGPDFVPGVEITHWNHIPIDRAVEIAAASHAGSNPAARRARGIDGLTFRALIMSPPPDEEQVTVEYVDGKGAWREATIDWQVMDLPTEAEASAVSADSSSEAAQAIGLDLEGDVRRRAFALMFSPHVIEEKERLNQEREKAFSVALATGADAAASAAKGLETLVQGLASTMPDVFEAATFTHNGRQFGHLKIRTFSVPRDEDFINEALRLIEHPAFPKDGMVVDVRGNGGGLIWAGERLLQLFTPREIEPTRAQFIATALTTQLCHAAAALQEWRPSLDRALTTGAAFSSAFPITPKVRCNDMGQRYYGPVLLLTDARCYSTTDMFATGFRDHGIGRILGVDDNTGAGGANVWTLGLINNSFQRAGLPAPVALLPRGADMRVAIRRTLRVGPEAGTEIEGLGVVPDRVHRITRNDLLLGDVDLLAAAGEMLEKAPVFSLEIAAPVRTGAKVALALTTQGLARVDASVAGRPQGSWDLAPGVTSLALTAPAGAVVTLTAYAPDETLQAGRRLVV